MMALTSKQREILHHTKWRAANRTYCGSREDADLKALCEAGLMQYLGHRSWLPDDGGYFTITGAGLKALEE